MNTVLTEVAVVGGGWAGLTAAGHLARAGLTVTLIDERRELGGSHPVKAALIDSVTRAGVDVRSGTAVWGIDDDGRSLLTVGDDFAVGDKVVQRVRAAVVLVATGATSRVIPFPGWELSGVQGADRFGPVGPATRVLVAGSGPRLVPIAARLADQGATVVGVAEAGPRSWLSAMGPLRRPAGGRAPNRSVGVLARRRVPVWQNRLVVSAHGDRDGRVATVELARTSAPDTVVDRRDVDAVVLDFGGVPQTELLALLGCPLVVTDRSGDLEPVCDQDGRCTDRVWVAGGASGSVDIAAESATASILATLGHRRAAGARRVSRSGYDTRGEPPAELIRARAQGLPGQCIVCRCESVTVDQVRGAVDNFVAASADPGAVRASTRAGMGFCGGRECAATVSALTGIVHRPVQRMPIRPLPLAALARTRPAP